MRSLPSRVRGDAGGVVTTPKASRKEAKVRARSYHRTARR